MALFVFTAVSTNAPICNAFVLTPLSLPTSANARYTKCFKQHGDLNVPYRSV